MDFYLIVAISIIIFICFIMFFKKKESYSPFLEFPFAVEHYTGLDIWATRIEIEEGRFCFYEITNWLKSFGLNSKEASELIQQIDKKYFERKITNMAFLALTGIVDSRGYVRNESLFDTIMKDERAK